MEDMFSSPCPKRRFVMSGIWLGGGGRWRDIVRCGISKSGSAGALAAGICVGIRVTQGGAGSGNFFGVAQGI